MNLASRFTLSGFAPFWSSATTNMTRWGMTVATNTVTEPTFGPMYVLISFINEFDAALHLFTNTMSQSTNTIITNLEELKEHPQDAASEYKATVNTPI